MLRTAQGSRYKGVSETIHLSQASFLFSRGTEAWCGGDKTRDWIGKVKKGESLWQIKNR